MKKVIFTNILILLIFSSFAIGYATYSHSRIVNNTLANGRNPLQMYLNNIGYKDQNIILPLQYWSNNQSCQVVFEQNQTDLDTNHCWLPPADNFGIFLLNPYKSIHEDAKADLMFHDVPPLQQAWNQPLTAKEWVIYGSILEDYPAIKAAHHFHDPTNGRGADEGDECPLGLPTFTDWDDNPVYPTGGQYDCWGWSSKKREFNFTTPNENLNPEHQMKYNYFNWNDPDVSIRKYQYLALTSPKKIVRDHYWALTLFGVGTVAHHIGDMAQPAHVRNDWVYGHFPYYVWDNVTLEHSAPNIELYLKREAIGGPGSFSSTGVCGINERVEVSDPPDTRKPEELWDSTNWDQTGPKYDNNFDSFGDYHDWGLSQFTNSFFLSERAQKEYNPTYSRPIFSPYRDGYNIVTISVPFLDIQFQTLYMCAKVDNQRYTIGMPEASALIPLLKSGLKSDLKDFITGIQNEGASNTSKNIDGPRAILDKYVYNDEARILLPRAEAYFARMLELFFLNDTIEVSLDPDLSEPASTDKILTITNKTDYEIEGAKYELYFDCYKDGETDNCKLDDGSCAEDTCEIIRKPLLLNAEDNSPVVGTIETLAANGEEEKNYPISQVSQEFREGKKKKNTPVLLVMHDATLKHSECGSDEVCQENAVLAAPVRVGYTIKVVIGPDELEIQDYEWVNLDFYRLMKEGETCDKYIIYYYEGVKKIPHCFVETRRLNSKREVNFSPLEDGDYTFYARWNYDYNNSNPEAFFSSYYFDEKRMQYPGYFTPGQDVYFKTLMAFKFNPLSGTRQIGPDRQDKGVTFFSGPINYYFEGEFPTSIDGTASLLPQATAQQIEKSTIYISSIYVGTIPSNITEYDCHWWHSSHWYWNDLEIQPYNRFDCNDGNGCVYNGRSIFYFDNYPANSMNLGTPYFTLEIYDPNNAETKREYTYRSEYKDELSCPNKPIIFPGGRFDINEEFPANSLIRATYHTANWPSEVDTYDGHIARSYPYEIYNIRFFVQLKQKWGQYFAPTNTCGIHSRNDFSDVCHLDAGSPY